MLRFSWAAAVIPCVLVLGSGEALAQPAGYTRSGGIGVDNNALSPLADYQVRLVINTQTLIAAGQMRADANDMVFTLGQCGATVLGHFIESGLNTASTVVWVKVPNLQVGVTRLTMWYGNAAAVATSSPRSVFIGTGVANDPISSTNQVMVASVNTVADNQRGFRFSPNVPALVVEFGKREPTGANKIVTLFDFNTQAIVRQLTVPGAAGSYVYTPITPFWLTQGTQYLLEIFSTNGEAYYYGVSSQISPDFTYLDMRYCNACTQNTFPTSVLTNYHYGNPDIRYYKRQTSTPEPAQVAVTGSCAETASCDSDCSMVLCGDGIINATASEVCDDGNAVNTDACVGCQNARCGDGHVRAGTEQCDDGNTVDTDACRNTCVPAACGDGVVQTGTEQCDDGNTVDTDACRNNCTPGGGMGGMGGGAGMGGIAGSPVGGSGGASAGAGGKAGASTGGTSTGGTSTGGTSTGGVSGEGGEGGDGQAGIGAEGGDDGQGGSTTGGRATGGRGGTATGGTATGGRTGGTSGTGPGEAGAGGEDGGSSDDDDKVTKTEGGCGCKTAGSRSGEATALSFALLGLIAGVWRRRTRKAS